MIKEIKLPEIAENIDSAVVLSVLVSEGDKIEKNDNIVEMESDKAAFDIPSDAAGVIKEIKVKEGDDVKVGQVIMTVETADDNEESEKKTEKEGSEITGKTEEEKSSDVKENNEKEKPEEKENKKEEGNKEEKKAGKEEGEKELENGEEGDKKVEKEEEEAGIEDEDEVEQEEETDEVKVRDKKDKEGKEKEKTELSSEKENEGEDEHNNEVKDKEKKSGTPEKDKEDQDISQDDDSKVNEAAASPSVRRLARELGIDINKVEGTGAYNRISSEDVKSYSKEIAAISEGKQLISESYELPDFSSFGNIERKSLSSIRKKIATNLSASWQTIPHVFHFDKADITELEAFRKKYEKEVEAKGAKLTVTAILLKIMAKALEIFPKFNSSLDLDNNEIIYKKYFHIGVAVDTDRGLLVPVIRDVNRKSILRLSTELGEIAENARNKKIKPSQLQGGNIAISNLGGIGGTGFTPIIYRPNVAVLGVARSKTEPVFIDGDFKPRLILPLTLSYDHRLIDGAEAARFLRWFCEALENPFLTMFKGGEDD